MQKIGNDIVDLSHPAAVGKYEDSRFVKRVLTTLEQEVILSASCPNKLLWAIWAAKESAYKAISRFYPRVSSSPKQYQVSFENTEHPFLLYGMVTTPETPVQIQAVMDSGYVHCLGVSGMVVNFHMIEIGIYQLWDGADTIAPDRESMMVRGLAKERIAKYAGVDVSEIEIRREMEKNRPGPPEVFFYGEKSALNISMSHDGRFVAYAFSR